MQSQVFAWSVEGAGGTRQKEGAGPQVDGVWICSSLPGPPGFLQDKDTGAQISPGLVEPQPLEPHVEGGTSSAWLQQSPGAC